MSGKQTPPAAEGALLINKPQGRTSHDVVDAARRILGTRQIGHLGTLDPLATGVLVLLIGRATRLARFYGGRRKRYACAIRFGYATDTYDADGEATGPDAAPLLTLAAIEPLLPEFLGRISQMPPAFSAKKVRGIPAHELARKKKPVELQPVEVEVYDFRITGVAGAVVRCVIECAAGTYIRSLAHDLGARYGSGAHLQEIVRTAVGEFTLDQCVTLDELDSAAHAGRLADVMIPLERLLPELPHAVILPVLERRVRHGAQFTVPLSLIRPGEVTSAQGATSELNSGGPPRPPLLRVFSQQQKLIAIAEAIVPRTYQPVVVLDAAP